jgi:hypothetical protein
MVTKLGSICKAKLLKDKGAEKAGVGGSTPSLATIIPKNLARAIQQTPVRFQSALTKRTKWDLRKGLALKHLGRCNPFSVRFQSALLCRVAENRCEHFSRSGHAITADHVSVELKR